MKKVPNSFEHIAKVWDAKTKNSGNISDQSNLKAIMKFLGNPKNLNVYEIACGNGYLSRKIKKAGAKEVYASDGSPTLIDMARNKYNSHQINLSVREASDFTKLPKKHFDAVIIHQGIFFIKDITKLMKGISSILKPGGKLIFTATHPLFQVFKVWAGVMKMTGKGSAMEKLLKYNTNYTTAVNKKWLVNGKFERANYLSHNRPLSYYVTECVKAGMLIEGLAETPSMTRNKNLKIVKSSLSSSFVIKAIKI